MTEAERWKIRDNKAKIQNRINRARYKANPYSRLINSKHVDNMLEIKMKARKCTLLEASELVREEVYAQYQ